MKKTIILFFVLILLDTASAAIIPMYVPGQTRTERYNNNGCTPPINFSIENKCMLQYGCDSCVNDYICTFQDRCERYVIKGDCNGNAINSTYDSTVCSLQSSMNKTLMFFIGILLVCAIIGGYLLWRFEFRKKPEDKYY
jgi:hypothetical protein